MNMKVNSVNVHQRAVVYAEECILHTAHVECSAIVINHMYTDSQYVSVIELIVDLLLYLADIHTTVCIIPLPCYVLC